MEQPPKKDLEKIQHWLGSGSINIFGRPFSGKDTQGRRLAELLDATLLGGGDIIRRSDAQVMKDFVDKGNLANQQEFLDLVIPFLSQARFNGKPLILSTVGRWHGEEEPILAATAAAGHPIKAVIALSISDSDTWQRWHAAQARGDREKRVDDSKQYVDTRLNEYRNKTLPVIEFYRNKGLLIEIDGTADEDTVLSEILRRLLDLSE